MKNGQDAKSLAPHERLTALIKESLVVATKANKHNKSLNGDNFYGNKLSTLRSDAAVAFSQLPLSKRVDSTQLATHIDIVFKANVKKVMRLPAAKEAEHLLKMGWASSDYSTKALEREDIFPRTLLTSTRRGYLVTVAKQMNGCYVREWYDACSVMMRRLTEAAIIEAYEGKGIAQQVKKSDGSYFQLTELVGAALGETKAWHLSRNTKQHLPKLRDLGHLSAHGRTFTAQKSDIDRVQLGVRVVVEEFLRHAGLLTDQ